MFSEPDLGTMLKVNEKDSRMTTLYIFQVCIFLLFLNILNTLLLSFLLLILGR